MIDDNIVIKEIQEEKNVESNLLKLIDRHSGIFIEMVKHYVPQNSEYSNRDDLLSEKNYHIYKAVKSFDFKIHFEFDL